jgi:hypothetical protein
MQTSDIPIHISPWARPRMKVAGSGLPKPNAQRSSARYTAECVNETASKRRKVT